MALPLVHLLGFLPWCGDVDREPGGGTRGGGCARAGRDSGADL